MSSTPPPAPNHLHEVLELEQLPLRPSDLAYGEPGVGAGELPEGGLVRGGIVGDEGGHDAARALIDVHAAVHLGVLGEIGLDDADDIALAGRPALQLGGLEGEEGDAPVEVDVGVRGHGLDPARVGSKAELLSEGDGLDKVLSLIHANLPARLAETAYVLAAEVAASDLSVKPEEVRFLELLAERLSLDKLTCAALERAARARHQRV